jgi:hypothetical protein
VSGSKADSGGAAREARRDVLDHAGQPGTADRYNALLRYLRGFYVRASKERDVPESLKADPTEKHGA